MIHIIRKIRREMLKKNKFLNYFAYAIGEILLIMVGILLALHLQNRNEEKKTAEIVNTTINLLKNEINTNKERIENVQEYHIMVRDTLKVLKMPDKEDEISKTLSFWRGMRTPRLQNAAFQTSIQSGINREMNPELVQELNNLYTYQDSYNQFIGKSSDIFFNADFTDVRNLKKIMASVGITMNDLYYYEVGLIKEFDNCLQKLDSLNTK